MRDLVWALLGLAVGVRSVPVSRRRIARLRASGSTFGSGRATESPLVVPVMAALCAVAGWQLAVRHDGDWTVAAHTVLLAACATLTLVDIDTHVLPRGIVVGATLVSFPLLLVAAIVDDGSFAGVLFGAFVMWALFSLLAVLSRGDLGGGDVTLAFLLGGHLGLVDLVDVARATGLSFVLAGLFALALLATGRGRRTRFAFGPFLVVGSLVLVVR